LFLGEVVLSGEILLKEMFDIELVDLYNPVLSLANKSNVHEILLVHFKNVIKILSASVLDIGCQFDALMCIYY
jgi:hypothetical protein